MITVVLFGVMMYHFIGDYQHVLQLGCRTSICR